MEFLDLNFVRKMKILILQQCLSEIVGHFLLSPNLQKKILKFTKTLNTDMHVGDCIVAVFGVAETMTAILSHFDFKITHPIQYH